MIYYHNISKNIYNESDLGDFLSYYCNGDIIKFSKSGNSLVYDMFEENLNIESEREFGQIRSEFLKEIKEFTPVRNNKKLIVAYWNTSRIKEFKYEQGEEFNFSNELKLSIIEEIYNKGFTSVVIPSKDNVIIYILKGKPSYK